MEQEFNHQKELSKHQKETLKFPKNFLWGSSTSAHQVEGNNKNSDWWQFEQKKPPEFRSGKACNHYEFFGADFKLMANLGHNVHRLSLEWSRLESEKGKWSEEAFNHYREVLEELKKHNIKICLTIHHFTNPAWLDAEGWEKRNTSKLFARFVKEVVKRYGDLVDLWITFNEPMVFLYQGWQAGLWPPNKKVNLFKKTKVFFNLVRAHKLAYRIIKKDNLHNTPVGIANNCQSFYPYDRRKLTSFIWAYFIEYFTNHLFYWFSGLKHHDFLGVNYYFHHRLIKRGIFKMAFLNPEKERRELNDLGWEVNPDGMFDVLLALNHYKKPIYITECGLPTTYPGRRQRFLVQFIRQLHHALQVGVDIKGFFYWSFMDNFEWLDGFGPRFGLVEIDYKTQKRTPRPSAYLYKRIIEQNGIDHELFKYLGHDIHYNSETKKVA